jgi:hypothetical protein
MSNENENELEAAPENEVETAETENAEIVDEESEPTPEEVEAQEQAAKEKEKRGAQKRIDRLTREKYELKAKAEYLERILIQQPETRQQQQGLDRSQFDSEAEYIEAIVEQRLDRERQVADAKNQEQARASIAQTVDSIYAEAEAESDDFDAEEFRKDIASKMSNLMADAIIESDISAKLLVHFNDNPKDVERIAALSIARQAVEIGKLEASLSSTTAPRKSAAPAPISKTLGKGKSEVGLSDNLSADEWMARRNKQLYGR